MHRFIIESDWIEDDVIHIYDEELRHLSQVLRVRIGDRILVFDGSGAEYLAAVEDISKTSAVCKRLDISYPDVESSIEITLLQGLPKSDKMDFIVQKAVELGVTKIVPVLTEFVAYRETKDYNQRIERWNRIAREATKQCGRTKLTPVMQPVTLKAAAREASQDAAFFLNEHERKINLKAALKWYTIKQGRRLSILAGPEGGISPDEAAYLAECGFLSITLGNRILRTETSSIAALAIIGHEMSGLYEKNDLCSD